ncbi:MAG TPA: hypothetical protein VKA21_05080, partial [Candidatus Binatia bacterium]|nr:hypothetical protein [Candidatus Binatia bacterium]
MTILRPIAILSGDTPAARAVAGGVASLLTAVGRWVEEVPAEKELGRYAAVVVPRAASVAAARARYGGPILVVDADLLDGAVAPAFAARLGGPVASSLDAFGVPLLFPRPLPVLAGNTLGDVPAGLAVACDGGGYALPLPVTPALRTVAGFWSLARVLEGAIAALIGEANVVY